MDKRALVIGIDAYGRGIPSLSSAVGDAEAVGQQLALAHGYQVTVLRDADATSGKILAALTEAIEEQLSPDSSFFFYYAGHGVAADDDDQTGPKGYLLAHDADLADQSTWLGMEALRAALDRLPARHLMLVLDCCYAGAFQWASTRSVGVTRRPLFKSQYERFRDGIAWQVLTSASYDELADDAAPFTANRGVGGDTNGHSPFAKALLEGLSGNAADTARTGIRADGVITATELYQFIFEKVSAGDRQTPGIFPLRHDNKGEYVFLAPGVELDLEPDPPLDDANNPWLGLDAYTAKRHEVFYGRKEAAAELLARVEADRLTAVVGASGSGESSLIRAGVVPALDPATWTVVECGELSGDPDAALRDVHARLAAAPADGRRLVVIDQIEDVFTHADDVSARFVAGVQTLIDADDGPTVLLAVRSDHEPRVAAGLGSRWADARYQVPPFTREDLRAATLGPARAKAVFFEPAELVDTLVDEVATMPGAAPLLSLTLAALYRQAQARRLATGTADRMICAEDHATIGGVVGIVHRRADELFDAADAAGQEAIRRIMLRLVDQKPEGLARRSVDRDELRFDPEQDAVIASTIDAFAAARLLTVGGREGRAFVEPAHDSLVTTWDHQLAWLARSGSQDVIRDAARAAREWDAEDHRSARSKRLWNQDPRLAELQRRDVNGELSALEHEFTAASVRRRRWVARAWKVGIGALAVLTVVAFGAGVIARRERAEAVTQASRASSRSLASEALRNVESNTDLAALLALEGVRVADTAEARRSLAEVLLWPTRFLQRTDLHSSYIAAIAFSPDGRHAATGDWLGTVHLWDAGEPFSAERAIPVGGAITTGIIIRDLVVIAEGDSWRVVVVGKDGDLRVIDSTGTIIAAPNPPGAFSIGAVSASGDLFAGVDTAGILHVFAIDEGDEFTEIPTGDVEAGFILDLTFSPDGTTLAWGDGTQFALWQWREPGGPYRRDVGGFVQSVAFSPDQDPDAAVLAVGTIPGPIYIVDRSDPDSLSAVSPEPVSELFDLAFQPAPAASAVLPGADDGLTFTLASAHRNGDMNLFDVTPAVGTAPFGFLAETMRGHSDVVLVVAFSSDGRIASGDFSGEVIWWLDQAIPSLGSWLLRPEQPPVPMVDAAVLPGGRFVSLGNDGIAWSMSLDPFDPAGSDVELDVGGEPILYVDAADDVIAVEPIGGTIELFAPDGTFLRSLAADTDGTLGFLALTSDGARLARVSEYEGRLTIWDVTTGAVSYDGDLPAGFSATSAVFGGDGTLWIGGRDQEYQPRVLEIDATSGAVLGVLRYRSNEGAEVSALAVSDDGRTLVTGATDRRMLLWDTETLEPLPKGEFQRHRGGITGIVFWDDGKTVISSDDTGDVWMWDVVDRRQVARLGGPEDTVASLEVDVGTATLIAPSEDGYVWTWSLDPDSWRRSACRLAGRNMTQAEWEQYGDGGTRVRHCVDYPAQDGKVRDADYQESSTR